MEGKEIWQVLNALKADWSDSALYFLEGMRGREVVEFLRSQENLGGLMPLGGRAGKKTAAGGIRGGENVEALSGVCAREGDAKGAGMCLPMFKNLARARKKGMVLLRHCLEVTRDNYGKGERGRWEGREEEVRCILEAYVKQGIAF